MPKRCCSSARTANTERIPLRTVRVSAPLLDDYNAARGGGHFPIVMRVLCDIIVKPTPQFAKDYGVPRKVLRELLG